MSEDEPTAAKRIKNEENCNRQVDKCDLSASKKSAEDILNDGLNSLDGTIKTVKGETYLNVNEQQKPSRNPVDESQFGIVLFVGNKNDQFNASIKTRYADFIVHEIDLDGIEAKLTSYECPVEENTNDHITNLEDLFDKTTLEQLSNVDEGLLESHKIDVTQMDKEMRTSVHHAIRNSFDRLESSYAPPSNDEKKFIVVTRRNKVSRQRNIWPRDRPDYTHFILYKENKDTMDAINNVAMAVNMKPGNFNYAGTKDRRAITSQWISAWRLEPKRLIGAMRRYNRRPFLKVGNFCFKKEPIRLGQLRGNKFDIVMKNLTYKKDSEKNVIDIAMEYVRENGFINYFGLQRFGTRSIATHQVGLAILQGSWKEAVDLILSYRFEENQDDSSSKTTTNTYNTQKRPISGAESHNACIDLWKSTQDANLVFKKYPHFRMTNEGLVIKSLCKSANADYSSAVASLPRNTRSMYVHSYQSLIWNKLTTLRLEKFGYKVILGDLVLSQKANLSLDQMEAEQSINQPDDIKESEEGDEKKTHVEEYDANIIVVTEDNLDKYTIFDVVLPLVGSKTKIPPNDVGKELERLLKQDELTLDAFKAREKAFVAYGSYRKILVKPSNLTWMMKQYTNVYENLVETDLDKLKLESIESNPHDSKSTTDTVETIHEALIASFELPPSAYATMCLREMMKKPSNEFSTKY